MGAGSNPLSPLGVCTWCLARAQACTGDEIAIGRYIGKNEYFTQALGDFAVTYADQTERDHEALAKAEQAGRLKAGTEI